MDLCLRKDGNGRAHLSHMPREANECAVRLVFDQGELFSIAPTTLRGAENKKLCETVIFFLHAEAGRTQAR